MSRALALAAQRPLGAYYTPDVVASALIGVLPLVPGDVCLEPSVGGGAFVRALRARGMKVAGVDIDPAAVGLADCAPAASLVYDFLASSDDRRLCGLQWVIGNPPYEHAEAHVRRAIAITQRHVAFLLRLGFLESAKRSAFWREHPPRRVWVLVERPSFTGGGTDSAAYGFFWWDRAYVGDTTLGWLSWRAP